MSKHEDPWAIEVIQKIVDLGNSVEHVITFKEKRITRGWVDVCWMWDFPILTQPAFLLVAEIETSKSDWPRIRSNASKAVELKPFIYAHIFKPEIKLTSKERRQLLEIHHGRHVLILDGNSNIDEFFENLQKLTKKISSEKIFSFTMIKLEKS